MPEHRSPEGALAGPARALTAGRARHPHRSPAFAHRPGLRPDALSDATPATARSPARPDTGHRAPVIVRCPPPELPHPRPKSRTSVVGRRSPAGRTPVARRRFTGRGFIVAGRCSPSPVARRRFAGRPPSGRPSPDAGPQGAARRLGARAHRRRRTGAPGRTQARHAPGNPPGRHPEPRPRPRRSRPGTVSEPAGSGRSPPEPAGTSRDPQEPPGTTRNPWEPAGTRGKQPEPAGTAWNSRSPLVIRRAPGPTASPDPTALRNPPAAHRRTPPPGHRRPAGG